MGRHKQPVDLVVLKGKTHMSKKEIEERRAREVRAPADEIKAPPYLTGKLKKEFDRLAQEMVDINIMTNLDCEALARFVVSEHNYQRVTKELLKVGASNPRFYDLLLAQEKLFKMARQAAGDLGLTITSRCKIVVPKPEEKKEESAFDQMFGDV